MIMHSHFTLLTALLAVSGLAASTPDHSKDDDLKANFGVEVDIVYPRNETYLSNSTIPIAVAVKNISKFDELGGYRFQWYIRSYEIHPEATVRVIDSGAFFPEELITFGNYTDLSDDRRLFIHTTDVNDWAGYQRTDEAKFVFFYSVDWQNMQDKPSCLNTEKLLSGSFVFSIEIPDTKNDNTGKGKKGDARNATGCPTHRQSFSVTATATVQKATTLWCAHGKSKDVSDGCAVTIDKPMANMINSQATIIAQSKSDVSSSREAYLRTADAAIAAMPIETALAMACVGGAMMVPALI